MKSLIPRSQYHLMGYAPVGRTRVRQAPNAHQERMSWYHNGVFQRACDLARPRPMFPRLRHDWMRPALKNVTNLISVSRTYRHRLLKMRGLW